MVDRDHQLDEAEPRLTDARRECRWPSLVLEDHVSVAIRTSVVTTRRQRSSWQGLSAGPS